MGKKVLIAESDNTVLQVISYFLKLEGFEITTVADGTVALDVASRFMPDVILLDPGLVGVNGIKISRDIRDKPEFKDVPILYVVENMDSLLKTGEDIPPGYGIIFKPIDPTKMVNTIKECMEAAPNALFEEVVPMSIEELLGWNVSEDVKTNDVIKENESAVLNDNLEGISGIEELEKNIPVEITEVAMEEIEKELGQNGYASATLEKTVFQTDEGNENPPSSPFFKGGNYTTSFDKGGTQVSSPLEKGGEGGFETGFSDEMIEKMISRISREFIEKVVMDVVPRIAEEEIKKEIERLKGEGG